MMQMFIKMKLSIFRLKKEQSLWTILTGVRRLCLFSFPATSPARDIAAIIRKLQIATSSSKVVAEKNI